MQENKLILHLVVVGFHHKKGYQVGVLFVVKNKYLSQLLLIRSDISS